MKTVTLVGLATVALVAITLCIADERAKVNTATGEIIEIQKIRDPALPRVKAQWLSLDRSARPVFNPKTHKLEETKVVAGDTVTLGWQVVPLTAEELAEIAREDSERARQIAERAARKATVEAIMPALAAGTATDAQVQTAVYEILKRFRYEG